MDTERRWDRLRVSFCKVTIVLDPIHLRHLRAAGCWDVSVPCDSAYVETVWFTRQCRRRAASCNIGKIDCRQNVGYNRKCFYFVLGLLEGMFSSMSSKRSPAWKNHCLNSFAFTTHEKLTRFDCLRRFVCLIISVSQKK